ncbi:MAG: ATP synthase F1 subunit gamma [Nitrospirae bacterium]|nr:ATP synthase F1 subunit gamma [Nitrospirota bacterium]
MASLQQTRRRIASVKNTQKITKAMKLVSASKLRRAQDRILKARPYALKMGALLSNLGARVSRDVHPLLVRQPIRKVEFVVIAADRGLCGSFNASIFRRATDALRAHQAQGREVSLTLVGRKARDYFRRRGLPTRHTMVNVFDKLSFDHAADLARNEMDAYLAGAFDEAWLVYAEFKSAMTSVIRLQRLMPIEAETTAAEGGTGADYLYEPSDEELLADLVPRSIEIQVWRALLESSASEQGARMMAMDSASRNAKDMITKLTTVYNKTRQAAITKELMDIVGGAEALK